MNNSLCRLFSRWLVFLFLIFSLWLFRNIVYSQDNSKPIQLSEITVTPGKFTIHEGTQSPLSLSKKEIDLFPLIDNDIARAAQIFPGVVSNDFSARFNVRGGEKDEILVRLDGMELFEPYHLQDFGDYMSRFHQVEQRWLSFLYLQECSFNRSSPVFNTLAKR